MKKFFAAILALSIILSLFLTACGTSGTLTDEEAEQYIESMQSSVADELDGLLPDDVEIPDTDIPDTDADDSLAVIELTPDTEYTSEGDYTLDGMFTDILSDRSLHNGWFYYYSEGTDSGVPWAKWECAEGMHTSCELLFNMTQLNNEAETDFVSRTCGVIVFGVPEDFVPSNPITEEYLAELLKTAADDLSIEVFPFTPMQDNPGQTDNEGQPARSIDGAILEDGETAKISLIADVSEAFYRSWEDENAVDSMWAFFSLDSRTVFAVNLREYLVECAD